jgi:hypothetical protein
MEETTIVYENNPPRPGGTSVKEVKFQLYNTRPKLVWETLT